MKYLLLIGIINCGTTGKILGPPCSNISDIPCSTMNLSGCSVSVKPSKNKGK